MTDKADNEATGTGAQVEMETISSLQHAGAPAAGEAATTPSYAQSQFETIVRRQRFRSGTGALKLPSHHLSSRSSTPDTTTTRHSPRTVREWEFSGWGSTSFEEISSEQIDEAKRERAEEKKKAGDGTLGAWMASAVAGVAVAGSPLYAFPPLVAVGGIYSPISLLIATLLLWLWRPIMEELASALAFDGANYVYLLNAANSKDHAIFGAALTLLDDVATAVVAAATAGSYFASEVSLPFDDAWMTVVFLCAIALIGLLGVKGTAEVTAGLLLIHLLTMAMLSVAGIVQWAKMGNDILRANWTDYQPGSASGVVRQIFLGLCVAFLGVTGFETAPDYMSSVRPGVYPTVLRSLQGFAIVLNAPVMLITLAVLPMEEVLGDASVLSSVARVSAGAWLRLWVSIDAILILCATILTGVISANALTLRLAEDGIFPRIFLRRLKWTGAPHISLIFFTVLSLCIYATTGGSLTIMSANFAMAFLAVMATYPLASLLFSFYRPFVPRSRRSRMSLNFLALALAITFILGNLVLAPETNSYFFAYVVVIFGVMWILSKRSRMMKLLWWIVDSSTWARKWGWGDRVVGWMRCLRGGPVLIFTGTDEINKLYEMMVYVRDNEETENIKVVHCYRNVDAVPSELEANCKILDETFPAITIDLVLLEGSFSPPVVCAIAKRLGVSISLCFVGSFTSESLYALSEFHGVRMITTG